MPRSIKYPRNVRRPRAERNTRTQIVQPSRACTAIEPNALLRVCVCVYFRKNRTSRLKQQKNAHTRCKSSSTRTSWFFFIFFFIFYLFFRTRKTCCATENAMRWRNSKSAKKKTQTRNPNCNAHYFKLTCAAIWKLLLLAQSTATTPSSSVKKKMVFSFLTYNKFCYFLFFFLRCAFIICYFSIFILARIWISLHSKTHTHYARGKLYQFKKIDKWIRTRFTIKTVVKFSPRHKDTTTTKTATTTTVAPTRMYNRKMCVRIWKERHR